MQYKTSISQRHNTSIALFESSFLIPRLPAIVAHHTTKAGEKPVHEATYHTIVLTGTANGSQCIEGVKTVVFSDQTVELF